MNRKFLHYFSISLLLLTPVVIFADTMQSASYKIQSDSINIGGAGAGSASYKMQDTLGEVGTGDSGSASYNLHAGYQQMNSTYIAITSASDMSLPNVNGFTGGVSTGSLAWTVTTDDSAGYSMSVVSATAPALKSSNGSFGDYTPSTSDPDFSFSIPSTQSAFGFSPEGVDIAPKYNDNGVSCNVGSGDTTDKCWDGFSTTPKIISERASANHPSGTLTTLKLRAETGSSHFQESGQYSVTLSVTALAL